MYIFRINPTYLPKMDHIYDIYGRYTGTDLLHGKIFLLATMRLHRPDGCGLVRTCLRRSSFVVTPREGPNACRLPRASDLPLIPAKFATNCSSCLFFLSRRGSTGRVSGVVLHKWNSRRLHGSDNYACVCARRRRRLYFAELQLGTEVFSHIRLVDEELNLENRGKAKFLIEYKKWAIYEGNLLKEWSIEAG